MNIKFGSTFAVVGAVCLLAACGSPTASPSESSSASTGESSVSASASESPSEEPTPEVPESPLVAAVDTCGVEGKAGFDLGDEGYTLSVDAKGDDESRGAKIDDVACILFALDVSDAIVSRIDSTRALDGTQDGEWDQFRATWSYHPDSGLNLIIEADQP